jgi:medium-chain acyl-[acyl-carrier-protein] hydrolase
LLTAEQTNARAWIAGLGSAKDTVSRLYCFPFAGGTATVFRDWRAPGVEICPILLPGREKRIREAAAEDLESLAGTVAQLIPSDLPFGLFGHSMGAVLAFEVARELIRLGRPRPEQLFVSASPAPQLLPIPGKIIRHLLPDEKLVNELRKLRGTPPEILNDPSMMQMLLPMLRADFKAVETYVYRQGEPLDCPITAFGGMFDQEVSRDELVQWKAQTRGDFRFRMFTGDHFFVNERKGAILEEIQREMKARSMDTTISVTKYASAGVGERAEQSLGQNPPENVHPASESARAVRNLSPEMIKRLSQAIKQKNAPADSSLAEVKREPSCTLQSLRAGGSRTPLFLIHPSGGSVIAYHALAAVLDAEQPVYAIDSNIAMEAVQDVSWSIEERAGKYIDLILSADKGEHCFLGGWSMGGLLAFEMSRQLSHSQPRVLATILIDAPAHLHPSLRDKVGYDVAELMLIAKDMAATMGKQLTFSGKELASTSEPEMLRRFTEYLDRDGLLLNPGDTSGFLEILAGLKNNEKAMLRYAPGRFDGRVLLIRSQDKAGLMQTVVADYDQPAFGWQSLCAQPVKIGSVPGDHSSLLKGQNLPILGSLLQQYLSSIDSPMAK